MNSLICCFFSNFLRVLRKVLVIPRLQRSKLWLTGTFSRASVWMAASVQCKDAAIQTEARENVPIRGNMVCFIVTIIVMVFFCLFPPTRLRHRYRASDRPALFFPLVSEYVKDTYMVLRCCTIVHTIYARPTPKRVWRAAGSSQRSHYGASALISKTGRGPAVTRPAHGCMGLRM